MVFLDNRISNNLHVSDGSQISAQNLRIHVQLRVQFPEIRRDCCYQNPDCHFAA
jgi:hypothetical protein